MLAYKKEYGCKYLPLFEAKLHSPMQRFLVLLFFITCFAVKAQIQADVFVDGDFSEKRVFADSLDQVKYINKVMIDWVNEGFYFSGLYSIKFDAEGSEIHLHKGDRTKLNLSGFKGKRINSPNNMGANCFSKQKNQRGFYQRNTNRKNDHFPGRKEFENKKEQRYENKKKQRVVYLMDNPGKESKPSNEQQASPILDGTKKADLFHKRENNDRKINNQSSTFNDQKEATNCLHQGEFEILIMKNGQVTEMEQKKGMILFRYLEFSLLLQR